MPDFWFCLHVITCNWHVYKEWDAAGHDMRPRNIRLMQPFTLDVRGHQHRSWHACQMWVVLDDACCPSAQQELAEESKRVWKFIVEREIEAPDRFQSIQTYRRSALPPPMYNHLLDVSSAARSNACRGITAAAETRSTSDQPLTD